MPEIMKRVELNKDLVDALREPLHDVFQKIGNDLFASCGDDIPNRDVIEMCLDADRLKQFGHHEASKLHDLAASSCDNYEKMLKFLDLHIKLN